MHVYNNIVSTVYVYIIGTHRYNIREEFSVTLYYVPSPPAFASRDLCRINVEINGFCLFGGGDKRKL